MLQDVEWKGVYRTGDDDLYKDFYIKALSNSVRYDRAVGYFSSKLLSSSLKGLSELIRSEGKIRLIIGHPLEAEEFRALQHAESLKEHVSKLSEQLINLVESSDGVEQSRFELLSWLAACGRLEIKFALRRIGMYHEKIGIIYDSNGDSIVFQGSANETLYGMNIDFNSESINVFKSWDERTFNDYGLPFVLGFEKLWENKQKNTLTIEVPSDFYHKISKKIESTHDFDLDLEEFFEEKLALDFANNNVVEPNIPKYLGNNIFSIYDHQKLALTAWKNNNFKGILKLATGSGKTITSIYGAVKLYEARRDKKQNFFLIIAVPYVELAIQWIENLNIFGIYPNECFGGVNKWKERLENEVQIFNTGTKLFCSAVVVNKTLTSEAFNNIIHSIKSESLMIIGDECHNHGSLNINNSLPNAYYKMGLSATPFRSDEDEIDSPFPDDAKKRIIAYYGTIVATYDLGDAINDNVLTPYEYHIIPVYLTEEEQACYDDLSKNIANILVRTFNKKLTRPEREQLTILCGRRSRLIGSASNKLVKLKTITKDVSNEEKQHTLFYTGEGRVFSTDYDIQENKTVIAEVSKVLSENGWRTSQFTGSVNKSDRKTVMDSFKNTEIDALVAMKVLDEGIDVPACKSAYILASTKNPRQYVQRRGRILRKYKGKNISKIYDFVVLPYEGNSGTYADKLRESELERIHDFTILASNKIEIEGVLNNYGIEPC